MTVELKDINVGDIVVIEAEVVDIDKNKQANFTVAVGANESDPFFSWINHSIIKEVKPKPFDWKDAKQGMAFEHYGDLYYYVAPGFDNKLLVIVCTNSNCDNFYSYNKNHLTRAPEHDLEITKG